MLAPLRHVLAGVLAAFALAGCATLRTPMLPPDLETWIDSRQDFAEPPFWTPHASKGYQRRLRLFVSPSLSRVRLAIRIDTTSAGATFAYPTRLESPDGRGAWEILEQRRTRLSAAELASLNALVAKSNLWTQPSEYWGSPDGDVCLDGVELLFERATPEGYRFSEANAQCTAPSPMLALAEKMIKLAPSQDPPATRFLR